MEITSACPPAYNLSIAAHCKEDKLDTTFYDMQGTFDLAPAYLFPTPLPLVVIWPHWPFSIPCICQTSSYLEHLHLLVLCLLCLSFQV